MVEHQQSLTHANKILFPRAELTKATLVAYYRRIAPHILPFLDQRPLTLRQFPNGISEPGFVRKHIPDYFPDYVKRVAVPRRDDTQHPVLMATADEADDLTYFAQQNVIELHMTTARANDLERPDQIVLDLDPADGEFEKVRKVAYFIGEMLDQQRIHSFVKTSGRFGLHIHIPLQRGKHTPTYAQVKPWAKAFAEQVCDRLPALTTTARLRKDRENKVYIDVLRNDYAQTVIAPYSVRALPGAPVALPIAWSELKRRRVTPQSFHLGNVFRRIAQKKDPWAEWRKRALNGKRFAALAGE